ncbi:radical SAM protein [Fervidobacterium sp.]
MSMSYLTNKSKREKPKIYPVFLPNLGCKTRCVYCNQYIMTGENIPEIATLAQQLDVVNDVDEIAFYGGTFTGLKPELMKTLLSLRPDIPKRISTRPDAIDEEVVRILKDTNVRTVELGVESLDEEVLWHSNRRYRFENVINALRLLQDFNIIVHLMVGLPYDDAKKDIESVKTLINEGVRLFRIHPVIVFKGTELCRLYKEGLYVPLGLNEALSICAEMTMFVEANEGKVIRLGYHVPQSQIGYIVAGPYHPSFGDMVRSLIIKKIVQGFSVKRIEYSKRFEPWIKAYDNNKLPVALLETKSEGIFFDGKDFKEMLLKYVNQNSFSI